MKGLTVKKQTRIQLGRPNMARNGTDSGSFLQARTDAMPLEAISSRTFLIPYDRHYESQPGISVNIVSGCGLDYRAIGVRSRQRGKAFSCSFCVQTGSEALPASCTLNTGGPFPGAKARPGSDADHSTPSSAEVENE
jgi:hypothetical protein